MNINVTTNKKTRNNRLERNVRKTIRTSVLTMLLGTCLISVASATGTTASMNDALSALNNLSDLFFSVIRVVGVMVAGWGLVP